MNGHARLGDRVTHGQSLGAGRRQRLLEENRLARSSRRFADLPVERGRDRNHYGFDLGRCHELAELRDEPGAGSLRLLATNDRIAPAEKSQAQLGNVLDDVADVSFTVLSGADEADGNRSAAPPLSTGRACSTIGPSPQPDKPRPPGAAQRKEPPHGPRTRR